MHIYFGFYCWACLQAITIIFFVDIVPCAALLQLSRDKINGHIHQHAKTLHYTLPYTISLIISGPVI